MRPRQSVWELIRTGVNVILQVPRKRTFRLQEPLQRRKEPSGKNLQGRKRGRLLRLSYSAS